MSTVVDNNYTDLIKQIEIAIRTIPDIYDAIINKVDQNTLKTITTPANKPMIKGLIEHTVNVIAENRTRLNNNMPEVNISYTDDDMKKLRNKLYEKIKKNNVADETYFYFMVLNLMEDGKLWFFYKAYERLWFLIDPSLDKIKQFGNVGMVEKIFKFFSEFRKDQVPQIEEIGGGYPQEGGMPLTFMILVVVILFSSFSLCNSAIIKTHDGIKTIAINAEKAMEKGAVKKAAEQLAENLKNLKKNNGRLGEGIITKAEKGAVKGAQQVLQNVAKNIFVNAILHNPLGKKVIEIAHDNMLQIEDYLKEYAIVDLIDAANQLSPNNEIMQDPLYAYEAYLFYLHQIKDDYRKIIDKNAVSGINLILQKCYDKENKNFSTYLIKIIEKHGYGIKDTLVFVEAVNILFNEIYNIIDFAQDVGENVKIVVAEGLDKLHIPENIDRLKNEEHIQAIKNNQVAQAIAKNNLVQIGVKAFLKSFGIDTEFITKLVNFLNTGEITELNNIKKQLDLIKKDIDLGLNIFTPLVKIVYNEDGVLPKNIKAKDLLQAVGKHLIAKNAAYSPLDSVIEDKRVPDGTGGKISKRKNKKTRKTRKTKKTKKTRKTKKNQKQKKLFLQI